MSFPLRPRSSVPALALLVGITLGPQEADAPSIEAAQDASGLALEVTYLANEGFLLAAAGDVVAIDAFVVEPYAGYAALPTGLRADLEGGLGAFAEVDLALASHVHRDHFQGEPAQRFLAARPECVLATSPRVIDALWEATTDVTERVSADTIRDFLPEPADELRFETGGITVDFLRLPHTGDPEGPLQNLGHVITVGDVTALHIGDAAMIPEHFEPYRLARRGIDVVFVPYWYFGDPNGERIVEEHFRPARLIACHVPPGEVREVTEDLADVADVVVPQRPLETFRVVNAR